MTNSIFEYHRHKHTTSLQRITAITHTQKKEREKEIRDVKHSAQAYWGSSMITASTRYLRV